MRIARTAGTVFVAGALVMTLAALAYPSMLGLQTTAADQSRVIANTSTGPVTEADRDFVVKVRAAGLWEYPVGMLGLQKGTTRRSGPPVTTWSRAMPRWTRPTARSPPHSASPSPTSRLLSSRASCRR